MKSDFYELYRILERGAGLALNTLETTGDVKKAINFLRAAMAFSDALLDETLRKEAETLTASPEER